MDTEGCPHLTPSHSDHASVWHLSDPALGSLSCVACVVEQLEDEATLTGRKKIVLGQLLRLMSAPSQAPVSLRMLNTDWRVTGHFIALLVDNLTEQDETFMSIAAETIMQCVVLMKSEHLVCCVLDCISQKSLRLCNFSRSVALFSVVGRLLHDLPSLAVQFLKGYASLVDYACAGMSYPDPEVQASVTYIYLHLYAPPSGSLVPAGVSEKIAGALLLLLSAHSQPLQLHGNALGLLKVMLGDEKLAGLLFNNTAVTGGPSVTAALKRALLSRHCLLKVAAVACLHAVIEQPCNGQHYADIILKADLAEFLFEVLSTTNELLIGSVFSALLILSKSDQFFQRCHAVYGIEALLRAMDHVLKGKTSSIINQGIALLQVILHRQPGTFRLFSHMELVLQCLGLIGRGISYPNNEVSLSAIRAFSSLLRCDHLLVPIPLASITGNLKVIFNHALNYYRSKRSTCLKKNSDNKQKKEALQARAAQISLHVRLNAFYSACVLAKKVKSEPNLRTPSSFCINEECRGSKSYDQHSSENWNPDLVDMMELLQSTMETHFIPKIMANSSIMGNGEIMALLFASLNILLGMELARTQGLVTGMVKAGFIDVCLRLRMTHGDDTRREVDSFLSHLYSLQLTVDTEVEINEAKNNFLHGISEVTGDAMDLLDILHQNAADFPNPCISVAQYAALGIIFTASSLGHRHIVPCGELHEALGAYLHVHQANLQALSTSVLSQLALLLAVSCEEGCKCAGGEVLSGILQGTDPARWCRSHHPALLHWSFTHGALHPQLPSQVLTFWLKSVNSNSLQDLINDGKKDSQCWATLVDYMSVCDIASLPALVEVLTEIVKTSIEKRSEILSYVSQSVPAKLQEILLDESQNQGLVVICLMELLVQLKLDDYKSQLTEDHIKIAFHVMRLALHSPGDSVMESSQMSALRLLACLLAASLNQGDTRVASLMLSNAAFLHVLEKGVRGCQLVGTVSSFLATLARAHHQHSLQVGHRVCVQEACLVRQALDHGPIGKLAALQLWSVLLKSTFPQQSMKGAGTQVRLIDVCPAGPDSADALSIPHSPSLRSILIFCLQASLQDIWWLGESSAECLEALFTYVEATGEVDHLLGQPWLAILLQSSLSEATGGALSPPVLRLCIKLVEFEVVKHWDMVSRLLLRHALAVQNVETSHPTPGLYQALEKVMACPPAPPALHLDLEVWRVRQGALRSQAGAGTDLTTTIRPLQIGEDIICVMEPNDTDSTLS